MPRGTLPSPPSSSSSSSSCLTLCPALPRYPSLIPSRPPARPPVRPQSFFHKAAAADNANNDDTAAALFHYLDGHFIPPERERDPFPLLGLRSSSSSPVKWPSSPSSSSYPSSAAKSIEGVGQQAARALSSHISCFFFALSSYSLPLKVERSSAAFDRCALFLSIYLSLLCSRRRRHVSLPTFCGGGGGGGGGDT